MNLQVKKNDGYELEFHWDKVKQNTSKPTKKSSLQSLESYLNFLQQIGQITPNRTPSKIYKNKFSSDE